VNSRADKDVRKTRAGEDARATMADKDVRATGFRRSPPVFVNNQTVAECIKLIICPQDFLPLRLNYTYY